MHKHTHPSYIDQCIMLIAGSPGKRPGSSSAARSTRELWLNATKNGTTNHHRSPAGGKNKTSVEQWSETLSKTGVGLTTQTTNKSANMSALKKSQSKHMAYSSTSHYLRQLVGTEKTRKTLVNDTPSE